MQVSHRRPSTLQRPRYERRRYFGILLAATVVLVCLAGVASFAGSIPMRPIAKFSIVPRHKYVPTDGPIELALRGAPPNSSHSNPLPQSDAVHAIAIYHNRIALLVGGRIVRTILSPPPVTNLQQLTRLVHSPSWLSEPTNGTFVLNAALIVSEGVSLTISMPTVKQLQLADEPSVFVGAWRGALTFEGVTVMTTDLKAKSYYRPFVVGYGAGTVVNIINSRFTGLGWNWGQSYGTSWVDGAKGEAVGSTFDHSYFGAYTSQTQGVVFSHDLFSHNTLYGLDPHTYSNHLLISHVVAEYNGAHGIIFSVHVHDSVIEFSVSRHNAENGIMMDAASSGNRIVNNTVSDNAGDGLVTASSPHNFFENNSSTDNRIGVRVRPIGSPVSLIGNTITDNRLAIEGIQLPRNNSTQNNGGQWDLQSLVRTWIIAGITWVVLAIVLALLIPGQRQRYRHALSAEAQREQRNQGMPATVQPVAMK